jgi:myotubularin-related protein 1/2
MKNLFAFEYSWRPAPELNGWKLYDIDQEFARMGLPDEQWHIVDWNMDFSLCPSYPPILCLPRTVLLESIQEVKEYRSKGRIPTLCWKNPKKSATISRSSQPMVGLIGKTCKEDEQLLEAIVHTNPIENGVLHIIVRKRTSLS